MSKDDVAICWWRKKDSSFHSIQRYEPRSMCSYSRYLTINGDCIGWKKPHACTGLQWVWYILSFITIHYGIKLMQRVVVQGGDWGSLVSIFIRYLCNRGTLKLTPKISRHMTELYEHKHVKSWHTNFPLCAPYPRHCEALAHDSFSGKAPLN